MSLDEMLEKIRLDRPNQTINKVISFKENENGYYDVNADMETEFFGTIIKHTHIKLPYPYQKYKEFKESIIIKKEE